MPETGNDAVVLDAPPEKLSLTRNVSEEHPDGFTWDFSRQKLKKKNKTDPDKYALVPNKPKTPEDFEKWLSFLNIKQAAITSYQRVRGMAANWTESSTNDNGKFIQSDFVKCVEEMSARGETLKDLNNERNELTNEIITITKDTKMSPAEKISRMEEIGSRLNEINEVIQARKEKNQEDAELEEAAAAQ